MLAEAFGFDEARLKKIAGGVGFERADGHRKPTAQGFPEEALVCVYRIDLDVPKV